MDTAAATLSPLRTIRKQRGMVLQELAVRADVSVTTIVAIEKWGHRSLDETYEKLAKALDVDVDLIRPHDNVELSALA